MTAQLLPRPRRNHRLARRPSPPGLAEATTSPALPAGSQVTSRQDHVRPRRPLGAEGATAWRTRLGRGRGCRPEAPSVRSALAAGTHAAWSMSRSRCTPSTRASADESAALLPAWTGAGSAPPSAYGEAKVSCETACRDHLADARLTVARAGLIVGYGDPSDRFGYWPSRFALGTDGDRVLVPPLECPVQFVDVRDLAAWLVDAGARQTAGVFDATGPRRRFRVASACARLQPPRPTSWIPGAVAPRAGVPPWSGRTRCRCGSVEDAGHNARSAVRRGGRPTTRPLSGPWRTRSVGKTAGFARERRAGSQPSPRVGAHRSLTGA
jgi:hypothetical protein